MGPTGILGYQRFVRILDKLEMTTWGMRRSLVHGVRRGSFDAGCALAQDDTVGVAELVNMSP